MIIHEHMSTPVIFLLNKLILAKASMQEPVCSHKSTECRIQDEQFHEVNRSCLKSFPEAEVNVRRF